MKGTRGVAAGALPDVCMGTLCDVVASVWALRSSVVAHVIYLEWQPRACRWRGIARFVDRVIS